MDKVNQPLRIGILLRNRHDGPGGLEKVLEIVARAMPAKNVELFFYGLYEPRYDAFTKNFKHLKYLSYPKSIMALKGILPRTLFRALQKTYVRFNGDKLFDEMAKDQLDALITMDLSKQFLTNYPFLKRFKEKTGIPLFSWIHLSLTGSSEATAIEVAKKIDLFDAHLAISHGIADELRDDYKVKNVTVVYNPVDAAELVERDKNRFVYIGRISDIKRVDSLLENLVSLKGDWHLDIFGSTGNPEGDEKFKAHITALNLEQKVTFHGWQKDAWDQVQSAGVTLLNSIREGLPLIIIESMMRGIPVLATDCPTGPADLITVGKNGWLYPMDEEFQSREYLQKILDGELELPSPEAIQASVQGYETSNYLNNFIGCIERGRIFK
ncbi:hypothetical protein B9T19_05030 [Ignatzschineria sp. F8392]|uniref:glycosyltransferase n=1 Tax=Ignatzschineria sp. F8392 TaxID=1980117 RepID=UPI000B99A628|nr:glycosyltransferase [Ignatzschineria sp. F8392]OYQ80607.1 hypothetical protein B9T19_05030 [Ignatzschineria sp. F8392]